MNEAKKHVLYIITKLELGGAQKVCLSLFKNLQDDATLQSHLISGAEGVLVNHISSSRNVYLLKSLKREVTFFSLYGEVKAFLTIFKQIRHLIRKYPTLVVHTHSTKAGLLGRWAAFFAGVKKRIHTIHGYSFHEHQSRLTWLVHYLLEFVTSFITTHYICVSQKDHQTGSSLLPFFLKKSSLIRAAVDYDTFYIPAQPAPLLVLPHSTFVFGTVSCFKPQKNLIDLLKAFEFMCSLLQEDDRNRVRLEIIGDGVGRSEIEEWIEEHGFKQKVVLLGWQHDVAYYMRTWQGFVMSSLWEGLPCAVVEALLSRLPVVAYDVGGINEVVVNQTNGFLIPPGNWQELGQKMKILLHDTSLHASLKTSTYNLHDFHIREMTHKHIALYKRL